MLKTHMDLHGDRLIIEKVLNELTHAHNDIGLRLRMPDNLLTLKSESVIFF